MTSPTGVLLVIGVVAVVALAGCVVPVRGGHGQHAHAGPGALGVWQLRASLAVTSPAPEGADDDEIVWPAHDPDEGRWSISADLVAA